MAGTWVFVEQKDGNIRKVTFEMLAEAKKFGDEVSAVVFGKGVEALAPNLQNTEQIKYMSLKQMFLAITILVLM